MSKFVRPHRTAPPYGPTVRPHRTPPQPPPYIPHNHLPTRIFSVFLEILKFWNNPTVSPHPYIFKIFSKILVWKNPHRIPPPVYFCEFHDQYTGGVAPTRILFLKITKIYGWGYTVGAFSKWNFAENFENIRVGKWWYVMTCHVKTSIRLHKIWQEGDDIMKQIFIKTKFLVVSLLPIKTSFTWKNAEFWTATKNFDFKKRL